MADGPARERPGDPIGEDVPNAARMYDYFLGGASNFAADRRLADEVAATMPGAVALARANRRFLQDAVSRCLDLGVRQFLDLGSGIPTVGNVHEIAHARDPDTRVAYVDHEPVAVAHARLLLADQRRVTVTHADLRDTDAVLRAPGVRMLLDLAEPVALLTVAVFHFVPDRDDPAAILARYREAVPTGSPLIFSHVSADYPDDPGLVAQAEQASRRFAHSTTPTHLRTRAELHDLLGGFDLQPPGLVDVARWSDAGAAPLGGYAAFATAGA